MLARQPLMRDALPKGRLPSFDVLRRPSAPVSHAADIYDMIAVAPRRR